jgi:hypothetical protein
MSIELFNDRPEVKLGIAERHGVGAALLKPKRKTSSSRISFAAQQARSVAANAYLSFPAAHRLLTEG